MNHPIFKQYPIADQKVDTSTGKQATPYHVYNGHLLLIGGTADFDAVSQLLADEQIHLVRTESGRGLMAIYIADDTEASHGPHTELQYAFYVTHQPTSPVKDSPFAVVHFLTTHPLARQMCYGLWNSSLETVAYNREILGLTPELATSAISRENGRLTFAFHDAQHGTLLAQGNVREATRQPLNAVVTLFRAFGFRQALRAAGTKVVETKVVNPINEVLPRNADAHTVATFDELVTQLFDPSKDHVEIAKDSSFGQLDFTPTFVQHMRGFKMVYNNPI